MSEGTTAPPWTDPWVRIMCDYCAEGIWDRTGAAGSVDELDLPEDLKDRIIQWQDWHDQHDPHEDPPVDIDWVAFSAEGLAIARAVKAVLPAWTVMYFDAYKAFYDPAGTDDRAFFEYEIILNPDGTFSP